MLLKSDLDVQADFFIIHPFSNPENFSSDCFGSDDDPHPPRRDARRDLRRRPISVLAGSRQARRRPDQLDRERRRTRPSRKRRGTGDDRKRVRACFAKRHQKIRGPVHLRRRNRLRRFEHDVSAVRVRRVADVHFHRKRCSGLRRIQRHCFLSSQWTATAENILVSRANIFGTQELFFKIQILLFDLTVTKYFCSDRNFDYRKVCIRRRLCRKTTILSCRSCLNNTGVEKMNNIKK